MVIFPNDLNIMLAQVFEPSIILVEFDYVAVMIARFSPWSHLKGSANREYVDKRSGEINSSNPPATDTILVPIMLCGS